MTKQKKLHSRNPCNLALARVVKEYAGCRRSLAVYLVVLVLVAIFLGTNFSTGQRFYVAGQIASSDVVADRYLLVEDSQATKARKRQVMLLQPPVYDQSMEPYLAFEQRLIALMREQNGVQAKVGTDEPSVQFTAEIGPEMAREILPEFGISSVQTFVLKTLLPLLRARLHEGLVGDTRSARVGRIGVIIRDLDTNSEVLRPDVTVLPDIQTFLTEISNITRNEASLSNNSRRAINVILAACLPATLTLNQEATQKRASAAVDNIEPVYYQIQKGELIVRRGDKVSREQQLKLQTLYHKDTLPLDIQRALGTFLCALFISLGFFFSPSGRPGSTLRDRDIRLLTVVVALTALGARGVLALSTVVESQLLIDAFGIAFPVAGAVGFTSMVFSARRYAAMGLLLSMLSAIALQLDMPMALFHFLSAMLATWLVTNAVNRQDAVWSVIPLIAGEFLLAVGASLVGGLSVSELPVIFTAVSINAVLTLILFFSMSPIIETIFGCSTRFRLMEFTSLEQPLMQEIMVTIPGTYHHSIVVANMVEAGAKAIGANSLLVKVAALYHDAGKLAYPQYFVENQFGGPNRHDRLSPSMSALIILSHVKKGVELCSRYKLGQEVIDIIAQHHGTRVVRYFYQKAVNLGENPRESDYSYSGPKPQTKEAAILLLADSVEASSRTLSDPTPARLKAHIDKIIMGIFSEGQLDESELTFKDLHLLGESFLVVLTGLFHQRIAYPEASKEKQVLLPAGVPTPEPAVPQVIKEAAVASPPPVPSSGQTASPAPSGAADIAAAAAVAVPLAALAAEGDAADLMMGAPLSMDLDDEVDDDEDAGGTSDIDAPDGEGEGDGR